MTVKVCMVGHGMMGTWHSKALKGCDATLHTIIGREVAPTRQFAELHGFKNWSVDFQRAVQDPEVDMVVVAGPSQSHATMALTALECGKHVLVEIPLALNLSDCEMLVAKAKNVGRLLGVVHPMRFRTEHIELCERLAAGTENIRHIHSRLFLHRLENVGSTGLRRSWTDNLLWHHGAHLVDVGLWLAGGGNPGAAAANICKQASMVSAPHSKTGMPMEFSALIRTGPEQNIVCTGSYFSRERIFDIFAVTDRNSYRLDILAGTLTTSTGTHRVASEEDNNAQVVRDFVSSIIEGGQPRVTGESVLPAMRILQAFEDEANSLEGPLP